MIIQEKVIQKEMLSISSASPGLKREALYEMRLHSGKNDYFITQIISVNIVRDYNNTYCDYIDVEFNMPLGDFVKDVYPNRDEIEVTLVNYTIGSRTKERLELIIVDMDNNIPKGTYSHSTLNDLNKDFTKIRAQCLNKTISAARGKLVHGIYKDVTVTDVISSILGEELNVFSSVYNVASGGLKMVPADNTRKYNHILVNKGTKLLEVPKVLQNGQYGVYNGDISIYLQTYGDSETLYISPKYRQNLLGLFDKKLYIVGVTKSTVRGIDSTYAIDGDMVKVLVERSNTLFEDDTKIRDKGTAVVSLESDAMMSRPVEIKANSMTVKEDSVTNRQASKTIASGLGPVEYKGETNNQYKLRTEGLIRDGVVVQVTWNVSNARLLLPMMPVIYVIERDGELERYEGVLQRVDVMTEVPRKTETSLLTLFLKKTVGVAAIKSKIKIF